MVQIQGARNAVLGEVRVGRAQHQGAVVFAGVDVDAQVVARAEYVFLLDTKREGYLLGAGETRTQGQTACGFFDHGDHQVHLVRRASHFLDFHIHIGEITQAVHAVAGQLDLVTVVPRRLQLAEFTA